WYAFNPGQVYVLGPGPVTGQQYRFTKDCFVLRLLSVIGRFPVRRHLPVPRQCQQLDPPPLRLPSWVSGALRGRLAGPGWRARDMPGMNSGVNVNDPTVIAAFKSALVHQGLVALLIFALLGLVWIAVRARQPGAAQVDGQAGPAGPAAATVAEPAWRQVLR